MERHWKGRFTTSSSFPTLRAFCKKKKILLGKLPISDSFIISESSFLNAQSWQLGPIFSRKFSKGVMC